MVVGNPKKAWDLNKGEQDNNTLVIGDIHGQNKWKELVLKKNWERIIFLGDYVDSFTVNDEDMLDNLRDIISYKRDNMDKVVLLLGNHDIQYIWDGNMCSGYRSSMASILRIILENDIKLFKICHEEDGFLFSHAGFTRGWEEMIYEVVDKEVFTWKSYNSYNELLFTRWRSLLFTVSGSRGGSAEFSGPLWADKSDTIKDGRLKDYRQIVGHTKVPSVQVLPHITYCDNLEYGDGIPLTLNMKLNDTIQKGY